MTSLIFNQVTNSMDLAKKASLRLWFEEHKQELESM